MPEPDDALPPLRYALAARAEAEASSSGAWSLRHLRICWTVLIFTGAAVTAAGWLRGGSEAALGAILGTLIVGSFFTVSAVLIARVGARHPARVMWVAVGAYVVKVIGLGFVLVLMPRDGAVDIRWMAGAVGLGLAGWLGAHLRFVWTNQIFYVDPT